MTAKWLYLVTVLVLILNATELSRRLRNPASRGFALVSAVSMVLIFLYTLLALVA